MIYVHAVFLEYILSSFLSVFVDYPGLSIGVPVREKNAYNTLVNNPYFVAIVTLNVALSKVGLSLGGFPPPSAATEHDN